MLDQVYQFVYDSKSSKLLVKGNNSDGFLGVMFILTPNPSQSSEDNASILSSQKLYSWVQLSFGQEFRNSTIEALLKDVKQFIDLSFNVDCSYQLIENYFDS